MPATCYRKQKMCIFQQMCSYFEIGCSFCGSAAASLMGSRFPIPLRAGCFTLSNVLCVVMSVPLRRADQFTRGVLTTVGCLTEYDLETSKLSRSRPTGGCRGMKNVYIFLRRYSEIHNVLRAGSNTPSSFRNVTWCRTLYRR